MILVKTGAIILIALMSGIPTSRAGSADQIPSHPEQHATSRDDATTSAFRLLGRNSRWTLARVVKMDFATHHTQGLIKIDDIFYVSAVEVTEATESYGDTDALWDFSLTRTEGKGRGWLFKFDGDGTLLGKVELSTGAAFHPGGMDFDGQYIWVPVAEYRPNGSSAIYRVDPDTMEAKLSFRIKDHIGNIIHDPARDTFHGTSWGSRRMYKWKVRFAENGEGVVTSESWTPNPEHYIDYQDCHYVGVEYMLCGGQNKYRTPAGDVAFGGIDLVDLSGDRPWPVHQLPVTRYLDDRDDATVTDFAPRDATLVVTNNAFWAEALAPPEATPDGTRLMRFYFMTENDHQANLIVYEVATPFPAR